MVSCRTVSIQWRHVEPFRLASCWSDRDAQYVPDVRSERRSDDIGARHRHDHESAWPVATDSEMKSLIAEIDADGKYRKAPTKVDRSVV